MIQELSNLVVADNTGAKRAMCFRILKQRKEYAHLGDVIRVAIKEASPTSSIKKGSVATAVIIRTGQPIRREDGSTVHFDQNACVLVDSKLNPIGTRVFGPVARELRDKNYMKIVSMAPRAAITAIRIPSSIRSLRISRTTLAASPTMRTAAPISP